MSGKYEDLYKRLKKHGQQHLLKFWSDLSDSEQLFLSKELSEINFSEINQYFTRANESLESIGEKLDDRLKPIPSEQYLSIDKSNIDDIQRYEDSGLKEISENRVGVLLLAGGQGTRLGFSYPKGMYDIGLPSHKTLFQIQGERILRLQTLAERKHGKKCVITWYIMTSEHTMKPTKEYFKDNDYFGLNKDNILMFEQGSLPCYDFEGKIFLDDKGKISRAPDGNGGLYRALRDRGVLADINSRGIKHLHAHSVDNILIKVADPVFIGSCALRNVDCAAKVVEKSSPNEAVGVVCKVDGKYQVVEYSEITLKTAELKNKDGSLTFKAGNICNHYFSTEFLNKICGVYENKLKLHVAKKKIPYVDDEGVKRKPTETNGIKIEKFIFDVFEFAENFLTVEVARDVEFSALKNADSAGKDCPMTSRQDLFLLHRKYIKKAGGILEDGVDVEISPLLSYAGEDLKEAIAGRELTISPVHLRHPSESEMVNGNHKVNGKL